jgi:Helicase HerA-like C-terminal
MGPLLLSRLIDLNDVREGVLNIVRGDRIDAMVKLDGNIPVTRSALLVVA